MPHFVCLGDVVVNVAMIVDAGWATLARDGATSRHLVVSFNAPTPKLFKGDAQAFVGDSLGVACRQISIPEAEPAAGNLWRLLCELCTPSEPLGTLPGKVIAAS